MANFDKAYKNLQIAEGGYVNDPNDRGGETYKGVSRRAHPNSEIWNIIDDVKKKNGTKNINTILNNNETLQKLIRNLYKTEYWDIFVLDKVKNQGMANEIFDDSVNRGIAAACKILCDVLGLNRVTYPNNEVIDALLNYGKL